MALPGTALTTLATVADELGVTSPGSEDSRLERYVSAASDAVRAYIGRASVHFDAAIVEALPGYGRQRLALARPPVLSVASVTWNGATVAPTEYAIEDDTGLLFRRVGWPFSGSRRPDIVQDDRWPGTEERTIVVTYAGGWVTPRQADLDGTLTRSLPYDVEHAAILTVAALYRSRGTDPSIAAESLGSASVTYRGSAAVLLPDAAAAILAPYRRILFA